VDSLASCFFLRKRGEACPTKKNQVGTGADKGNFDCSTAADLYSLNDEYAAERDAISGSASDAVSDYAAPLPADDGYAAAAPAEYAAEASGRRTGRQRSSGRPGRRGGF